MEKKITKIRIGSPGKFDDMFALTAHQHPQLMEYLYSIVWLDSGELVPGIGSFFNPIQAENYVKDNRNKLIDREIENILLINS